MPNFRLSVLNGAHLKAARAALGLTQKELGEALGISNVEVYRKESGERPITLVQAVAIEGLLLRNHLGEAKSNQVVSTALTFSSTASR